MRPRFVPVFLAALAAFASPAMAQLQSVGDVGLYLDGGNVTVLYGQECGPFRCTPFPGSNVAGGEVRSVFVFGAQSAPFAVAIGFPFPVCIPFPGVGNALLLDPAAIATIGIGTIGFAPPFAPCQQGAGLAQLAVPTGVPAGIAFRLQALTIGP